MTLEELIDFIERRMSMSHVYQPLLIRALLDAGGTATLLQTAIAFVSQDESLINEAEKTIVRMPTPVLQKHGVGEYDKNARLLRLNVPSLSLQDRARLRMLCDQRLGEYLAKRGMSIWDYRLIDDSDVPYDLRYRVLAESDRRCALCGVTPKERPLDVDHIIPRTRGGTNDTANLQVLCSRCNRAKGNRDTRDFRVTTSESQSGCPFCPPEVEERAIDATPLVRAVPDQHPVTKGHTLLVPRRPVEDALQLTEAERQDAHALIPWGAMFSAPE